MKECQSLFFNDGTGNRLQATRSGVTTRYIYDAAGNLLAEADSQNNIARYYIYGLGLLAMVTSGNQVYCYHFNVIGSTIAMTDQTQTIVNKYVYDPFGNILNQVEAVTQPFKFVGQYGVMTEPNGFYYMRAKYYDPDVGRFISEDPIGFDGGDVNLYAYVGNNPVNGIDPEGLWVLQAAGTFLGAGVNAYKYYGAYKSGQISSGDYAKSIALGGLTGLISSVGGGILSGALMGGAASALNNLGNQYIMGDNINGKEALKGFGLGAAAGLISGVGYGIGYNILRDINPIGKVVGSSLPHYGNFGGIAGNIAGTLLTETGGGK